MKNGIVTAALVIIGFTVPLALAWHHGDFQADEPEVVASTPVRLASAAPVEATAAVAAQVAADVHANADSQSVTSAEAPPPEEPPSTPPQQAPEQVEGNSSASDANPAPSEDNAPVDEAREEIRANRRR